MLADYTTGVLVQSHSAALRREAGAARLAALARCCQPSTWARTARHTGEALRQLRSTVAPERRTPACCTA